MIPTVESPLKNSFEPELLYLIVASLFLVQYIGKHEYEELYMQVQLNQTFSVMSKLCVAYRKCIILNWRIRY